MFLNTQTYKEGVERHVLLQTAQLQPFSFSLCRHMWWTNVHLRWKHLAQVAQMNLFWFRCTTCLEQFGVVEKCLPAKRVVRTPHSSHLNGFSPVWTLRCLQRLFFRPNPIPHTRQTKGFFLRADDLELQQRSLHLGGLSAVGASERPLLWTHSLVREQVSRSPETLPTGDSGERPDSPWTASCCFRRCILLYDFSQREHLNNFCTSWSNRWAWLSSLSLVSLCWPAGEFGKSSPDCYLLKALRVRKEKRLYIPVLSWKTLIFILSSLHSLM